MLVCISANKVSFLLTFSMSAMWFSLYCNISLWRLRLPTINHQRQVTNRTDFANIRNHGHLLHSITIYDVLQQPLKGSSMYFVKTIASRKFSNRGITANSKIFLIDLKELLCLFFLFPDLSVLLTPQSFWLYAQH